MPNQDIEARRASQREWARKKYRRERGLPDDADLPRPYAHLTPEENAARIRKRRRAADRKRYRLKKGLAPDAKLNSRPNVVAARKVLAKQAAERDRALIDAERVRNTPQPVKGRKPGRILARCGWAGL